jgi:hypothetical protein
MVTDERERLMHAIETLEHALRFLAEKRLPAWRQRLMRDLRAIDECLREHCAAAERPGGTLADVEVAIGRLPEVAAARSEHHKLTALAADLFAAIEHGRDAPCLSTEDHHRGTRFTYALHRHLLAEIDLVQIRYTLDVGIVD